MTTPDAACGRLPLKRAPPAAWQSQFRGGRLGMLSVIVALMCPMLARAQTVSMAGSLGDTKALLLINGAPHTLTVGSTIKGVTLKRVTQGQAEVEIAGKTVTVAMGGAPASVGGGGGGGGATGREILIAVGPGGHFMTSGQINGKAVQFMVDTGATSIAMGRGDAERLGIDWKNGQRGLGQTAGGVVSTHSVSLTSVRIGDVEVFGVNAIILPAEMPFVLLGNSFLSRFSMRRDSNVMRLEKRD